MPLMRIYCLILAFTCLSVFASEVEISEGVWIDGNSFYKTINHKKNSTIYFSDWSPFANQFLTDDNYYVALQLDKNFDPLPEDGLKLPSITTISAIADEDVRHEYYRFLENFGRTKGINHVVLPDTIELSSMEKQVLKEANTFSPFYFLNKSSLSYSFPESKKAFENEITDRPVIWIAGQNDKTGKLNRWSSKLSSVNAEFFYSQLSESKSISFVKTNELTSELKESIFSLAAVLIDPNEIFPLRDHTITYLGMDYNLKKRLKQYVKVLDYRAPGVTCIVDRRVNEFELKDDDVTIQLDYTGPIGTGIVLPEVAIKDSDVIIAKMLFGAHSIQGRSDISGARQIVNPGYLGYSDPDVEGMRKEDFYLVDSLASEAIYNMATPGIQIAVVKNGSLITEKSFGYYTYDSIKPVSNTTLYDIASVTKVLATLPAIALLLDQGEIQLDDSISMYLEDFRGSNKSSITIRQLLAHNSGVKSYVPFWSMMMDGDRLDAFYYKTPTDEANDIRTYGLEPHPVMADSLKSFIVSSGLIKNPKEYRYSDIGFMILHLLVERVSGVPFEEFLTRGFYQPMGLFNTTFNPIKNGFTPRDITPTEYDSRYRGYQVWGEVHDRNASVFGGVAGHAGLFSNASDIAKMMFMFMNNGFYGGRQYISEETLDLLNVRYFEKNRRGLGWDKKDGEKDAASKLASDSSYGHTGFTGSMIWADPEQDLIFVFLSNRIYPDANNHKLMEMNTRTNIHDILYQSIENFE